MTGTSAAPRPRRGAAAGSRASLRVAVHDPQGATADWISSLLPGQSVEVVRCASIAELRESAADLAVVCTTALGLEGSLGEVATLGGSSAVAVLVGATCHDHPMTRLMEALAKAKHEWEATFDALREPLAILDADGTVRRANLGFARSVGCEIRDVLGRSTFALLGSATLAAGEAEPVALSLADGRPRSAEVTYANLKVAHLVSLSPLAGRESGLAGCVLLVKDLSEQKAQRERMFQAARLADVGHLAAGVAHEINTPLASIALRAESLLRSADDPSLRDVPAFGNFPRYLKTIEDEVFRCKKIIKALLEFSARQQPEKRPLNLNPVVESATDLVEHQARLAQVRVEKRLAEDLPSVPADRAQIQQVLVALLMNALDAVRAGGRITVVSATSPPGHVILSVEDDGVGIPPEIRDKIWSPFFSTKPFPQGTGLGLAICHGIVTAHGGAIDVDSEPGKGTRMRIRLPVTDVEVRS